MELTMSDEDAKKLLTEIMVELMITRKELIREIIVEAMEDVALANAIIDGKKDSFVSEEDIFSTLDVNKCFT
ncbi:hypothetical protein MCHI_002443 [Candidatus Magnetoovum chiemensis]|nr:hypothetical protein MCHI_002443 [Candidatus Magnetoovum chiemensis]